MENKQVKKNNSEEENALNAIEEIAGNGAKLIIEDTYKINPETLERV